MKSCRVVRHRDAPSAPSLPPAESAHKQQRVGDGEESGETGLDLELSRTGGGLHNRVVNSSEVRMHASEVRMHASEVQSSEVRMRQKQPTPLPRQRA